MRINKKNNEPPDEEGAPAWMTTYSDMITLLLAFFVLLFSFSTIDAQKWEKIVASLSGTPFVAIQSMDTADSPNLEEPDNSVWETPQPTATPTPTPPPTPVSTGEVVKKFDELYQKIKIYIKENDLGDLLQVEKLDDAILVRMTGSALFDSGKAQLKDKTEVDLLQICKIFGEYERYIKMIRIEGHTDNVPMYSSRYLSNWELSSARAAEVLQYVNRNSKLDGTKLSIVGYGEFHPIATNDTKEGRAKNRRVDFVIESIIKD